MKLCQRASFREAFSRFLAAMLLEVNSPSENSPAEEKRREEKRKKQVRV